MSPHFIDKETETLRAHVICQWSHSWWMAELGFEWLESKDHGLKTVIVEHSLFYQEFGVCDLWEQKPG